MTTTSSAALKAAFLTKAKHAAAVSFLRWGAIVDDGNASDPQHNQNCNRRHRDQRTCRRRQDVAELHGLCEPWAPYHLCTAFRHSPEREPVGRIQISVSRSSRSPCGAHGANGLRDTGLGAKLSGCAFTTNARLHIPVVLERFTLGHNDVSGHRHAWRKCDGSDHVCNHFDQRVPHRCDEGWTTSIRPRLSCRLCVIPATAGHLSF